MTTPQLATWVRLAIALATENVATGGRPFGSLVVLGTRVVSTGTNDVLVDNDPTAHAEIVAIRRACRTLGVSTLAGCELITSCEPCPMCLAAALWARVDQITYAATRYDAAVAGFEDAALYRDIAGDGSALPIRRVESAQSTEPFDDWRRRTTDATRR